MAPAQEISTTVTTGDHHLRQAIHLKPITNTSNHGRQQHQLICERPEKAYSSMDSGVFPQSGSACRSQLYNE